MRCLAKTLVPQEKLIHIAASAGKNGGSGSGGMMQSSAWDPFNHTLGFGSLVPGARQANWFIRVPSLTSTLITFKLDSSSTNGRAKLFPPDACLSRSCRLLADKPPNGTRRGLIPGPLNRHPCAYPLSLAHADIQAPRMGRSRRDLLINSPHGAGP